MHARCALAMIVVCITTAMTVSAAQADSRVQVLFVLRILGLDSVADPLGPEKSLFRRSFSTFIPGVGMKNSDNRPAFLYLQAVDSSKVERSADEPELVIKNFGFEQPFAVVAPGQSLRLRNESAYTLNFSLTIDAIRQEFTVGPKATAKAEILGSGDGILTCTEFNHIKALVFRAQGGYFLPLKPANNQFVETTIDNVTPGVYQLRIWAGKWWTSQAVRVGDKKMVLRIDLDATAPESTYSAIENPPEETLQMIRRQQKEEEEKRQLEGLEGSPSPSPSPAPSIVQPSPKPPAAPAVKATSVPAAKPATATPPAAPKPPAQPGGVFKVKPAEKPADKDTAKDSGTEQGSGSSIFKIKSIEEN